MKIEDQVCTLQQAIKLKELGVIQQSLYTWYGGYPASDITPQVDLTDQSRYDVCVNGYYGGPDRTYAAYTGGELGVMLSDNCHSFTVGKIWTICVFGSALYRGTAWLQANMLHPNFPNKYDTEASARAAWLIYALENKRLSLYEVNRRLHLSDC